MQAPKGIYSLVVSLLEDMLIWSKVMNFIISGYKLCVVLCLDTGFHLISIISYDRP